MIKKTHSVSSTISGLCLCLMVVVGVMGQPAVAQTTVTPPTPPPPVVPLSVLNASPVPAQSQPNAALRKPNHVAKAKVTVKDEARVPAKVQALMTAMTASNGIAARAFLTPSGLWGIAIEKEGGAQVVFTDSNASTVTIGVMLTLPDKRNVGADYLAQKMPSVTDLMSAMQKQTAEPAALTDNRAATPEELQAAQTAYGFSHNLASLAGRKQIYAFIDPLCGYCANAWKAMAEQPALAASHQIKWIPMALGEDLSLVAAMLSDNTSERIAVTTKIYQSTALGTMPQAKPATPVELAAAQTNAELVKRINIHSTPTFLLQIEDGSFVRKEGFESVAALLRKVK